MKFSTFSLRKVLVAMIGTTQGSGCEETSTSKRNVLMQRVMSAIILIPAIIVLLVIGRLAWAAAIGIALLLAAREYQQLMIRSGLQPHLSIMALIILGLLIGPLFPSFPWTEITLTLIPPFALVCQWLFRRNFLSTAEWALTVAGGLYLGWLGHFYLQLRLTSGPSGLLWTAFALLVTWSVDTGAYLIGSRWGHHKMVPRLSPGKTWEGYLTSCIVGIIVGYLLGWFFFTEPGHGAMLGGLIGSLSILGDLSISMMKRNAGVKDSGYLIPGQGGMLDRLDSLLWSGMITFLYTLTIPGS